MTASPDPRVAPTRPPGIPGQGAVGARAGAGPQAGFGPEAGIGPQAGRRAPVLVRTRAELAAALDGAPAARVGAPAARVGAPGALEGALASGKAHHRGVVMTMGALHEGHLSLVSRARELADQVVVTIFVNPLQFAPGEDLDRYPRDLDGDLALLTGAGADIVFAPTPDVMFPGGEPVVRVTAGRLGEVLEGVARPGHLDGALTIVLKLMALVRPDVAIFGQKDAQQVMAVERMVRDLDVPVEIVAAPTVRDTDGLALSSRNAYLSPRDRDRALVLSRALRAGEAVLRNHGDFGDDRGDFGDDRGGVGDADAVRAAARAVLAAADLDLDYLALVDPRTAEEVLAEHRGRAVLAVAARFGVTRLIDNVPLWLGEPRDGAPGAVDERDERGGRDA